MVSERPLNLACRVDTARPTSDVKQNDLDLLETLLLDVMEREEHADRKRPEVTYDDDRTGDADDTFDEQIPLPSEADKLITIDNPATARQAGPIRGYAPNGTRVTGRRPAVHANSRKKRDVHSFWEIDGNPISPTYASAHRHWNLNQFRYNELRPGRATDECSCDEVGPVPDQLRQLDVYNNYGYGVSYFYQKYLHAYGIPIMGSANVTDRGLKRACYTVCFLLACRYDLRDAYYQFWGKVALIADIEQQTDLIEYNNYNSAWDARARGLGATFKIPLTSAGDDNQRCDPNRYWNQDILIHEFIHSMHLLAANYVIPGFHSRLVDIYKRSVLALGKWSGTYAGSKVNEYLATAGQIYFNSFEGGCSYRDENDNCLHTREDLEAYDPEIKALLDELFPCPNEFIHRCEDIPEGCTPDAFVFLPRENEDDKVKLSCNFAAQASYSIPDADACAMYTCQVGGNAFNFRRTYCYPLICPDVANVEIADTYAPHDSYVLYDYPLENGWDIMINTAPKQDLAITQGGYMIDRCADDVVSDEPCEAYGDDCIARGCCWNDVEETCLYPLQDCNDYDTRCPKKSTLELGNWCETQPEVCRNSCDICDTSPFL